MPADRHVEAGIVALKSRTIPAADAIAQSLAAVSWLKEQGCTQIMFKYCSTFDSTPEGNIGPVIDALADALVADRVVVCPAFPSLGRAIYEGHLFVGGKLLSESGMQDHPLTPMTDPDLRRWLAHQSKSTVGHVGATPVLAGRSSIKSALDAQHAKGARLIVVDTLRDDDLIEIAAAVADRPLITGGSGIALGLPENFRARGQIGTSGINWTGSNGPCIAMSGSCSIATRAQIAFHTKNHPTFEIRADAVMSGAITPNDAATWAKTNQRGIPLIYSSTDAQAVGRAQEKYGKQEIADHIEDFFACTARILRDAGCTRIITAGGETSGAVIAALGADALEIGPEIDPGVPAVKVVGVDLALALKSGNFGREDFFAHAAEVLKAK